MNNRRVPTFPVMELPMIAFLLAIAAGSMDGYTYFIGKAFSTVQSGNIILIGQTIATKSWDHLGIVLVTVLCFGIGSVATGILEVIGVKKKEVWAFEILIIEAIVLILLGISGVNKLFEPLHLCMIISFLAGMQGNAFHKIDGMLYGNVAVTLVVQLAFNYIVQAIAGQKDALKNSWLYFLVLIGFACGGLMGTFLTSQMGEKSLWFTAIFLLGIAIYSKVIKAENHAIVIDPD
ncbi:YoaK family protein [uncultured Enterococcus sp.]|uniref:YoaK family protein n=1 Tax=uncultured Enterococcus sp. TaxID=167972 RepID=UPI0025F91E91|nr:YoaK family protein [uncultured Enterococcus sp.]